MPEALSVLLDQNVPRPVMCEAIYEVDDLMGIHGSPNPAKEAVS